VLHFSILVQTRKGRGKEHRKSWTVHVQHRYPLVCLHAQKK
jgi:hypothetical protein